MNGALSPPIEFTDATARLLALASPLTPENVVPEAALGRYLAQDICAARTQPAADLSAMDGYALCGPDLSGPWEIIGESAAGHPFAGMVGAGQAVRISTGALIPSGTDTILLQEDTAREGPCLILTGDRPETGRHIRRAGFDFSSGEILLTAGTRITPAAIALALSGGHGHLAVRRRPQLAIIDSGDELAADPARCAPHQIPASNGAMLSAMAGQHGCEISRLGPVPDDRKAIAAALRQAESADLVVTTGGASVGDHDLMRPALEDWGADIAFWRVAIKPGKPIMVARRGQQLVIGLPGNPVSSYVTGFLFLLPLLRVLSGAREPLPHERTARLARALRPVGKRTEFLRGRWDGCDVTPLDEQDSSALASLAQANALIIRPAHAAAAASGSDVPIYSLENGGIA